MMSSYWPLSIMLKHMMGFDFSFFAKRILTIAVRSSLRLLGYKTWSILVLRRKYMVFVHFSPYIENEVLEILSLRHFLISVSEPINTKQKYILVGVQIKCRCNPFDSLFVVQTQHDEVHDHVRGRGGCCSAPHTLWCSIGAMESATRYVSGVGLNSFTSVYSHHFWFVGKSTIIKICESLSQPSPYYIFQSFKPKTIQQWQNIKRHLTLFGN